MIIQIIMMIMVLLIMSIMMMLFSLVSTVTTSRFSARTISNNKITDNILSNLNLHNPFNAEPESLNRKSETPDPDLNN